MAVVWVKNQTVERRDVSVLWAKCPTGACYAYVLEVGRRPITVGSVSRENAARSLPFLEQGYRGRRNAIREVTHLAPELVFWISPEGRFVDARDGHLANPPKGMEEILDDEPDYGGFLRGRVASYADTQFVVVYCRPTALAAGRQVEQFAAGLAEFPVPVHTGALVISDNADLYGTVEDLLERAIRESSE